MTPEDRADDLDGIAAALQRAFPDRTEELLAETTLALWPFAFVCWVCSVGWIDRTVCGACRRLCRALVEQARVGRTRPGADMVISELGRALALVDFPRADEVLAKVREGLAVVPENALLPTCRFCETSPPHRQLDAIGGGRRICAACVVRIATAGDNRVR